MTGSIDYLKIGFSMDPAFVRAMRAMDTAGAKIKIPRKGNPTVHEPTVAHLQLLLDHYPQGELAAIEIAVDFYLRTAVTKRRLQQLHNELRHALMPGRFGLLLNHQRKIFNPDTGKVVKDRLGPAAFDSTLYYRRPDRYAAIRLYVKALDNGRAVDPAFVRLEVTLDRGGCQVMQVHRVAQLRGFLLDLRKRLSRAFALSRGVKFNPHVSKSTSPLTQARVAQANAAEQRRLEREFSRHGAYGCLRKGLIPAPDPRANRQVGSALGALSRRCRRLRFDPKNRSSIEAILREANALYLTKSDQ